MSNPWKTLKTRNLVSAVVWTLAAAVCAANFFAGLGRLDLHFFASAFLLITSVICAVSWWLAYRKTDNTDHKTNQEEQNND